MKTVVSIIITLIAGIAGLWLGIIFSEPLTGALCGINLSMGACIIYTLNNKK